MAKELLLKDFVPQTKLIRKETVVEQPRYSVIDAHNHLGGTFGENWLERPLSELLDVLNQSNVEIVVDLDGGWGEDILDRHLDHFKAAAPDRFIHFGGVNWSEWKNKGNTFGEWAAKRLETQVARGAQGLKIWKGFGLNVRDERDDLVAVDDPRLDPLWQTAAELNMPIIIHVADPVAFFDPMDSVNERVEELSDHPDWHFPSPPYPAFMTIMDQFSRLILRHAKTTFIGAHVGCYSENLQWVSNLLDQAPNFYVDIGARINELGRQPYASRKFFLQHSDRILFGMDLTPAVDEYRLYYRFLETDDEYFNYSHSQIPSQGRWHIYGLHLPDEVLKKIYQQNAQNILLRK